VRAPSLGNQYFMSCGLGCAADVAACAGFNVLQRGGLHLGSSLEIIQLVDPLSMNFSVEGLGETVPVGLE
jgi:hypothetical protein